MRMTALIQRLGMPVFYRLQTRLTADTGQFQAVNRRLDVSPGNIVLQVIIGAVPGTNV